MPRDVFSSTGHAAFLFDMDGTVLTSIAAAERVWRGWARDHGLDPDVFLPTLHGKRAIDTVRDSGVTGIDPEAEAKAILDAEVEDVAGIEPIGGAPAFLDALPPARWAIVTSAPRRLAEARIAAAGLPMPRVLISGDDVTRGKPAPDPFHLGARELGVATEDCLIFEDAAAGIEAAQAAGAPTIVVTAGHPAPLAAAEGHVRIDRYNGLTVETNDDGRLVLHQR
ncbi:HAD-IA family hydrolase [Salinisphaera sp. Q1T1-3]|uniref:HAD-IA family hydrolase n=1 Tax=Salinisphaera sp. Q1T1-3 TaxID=2321229 RepID=UPI000E71CEA2|nr:HAD-IA family hydrolase [Salinisphaera sp. Q1T1-3]RJS91425.1 HAD family hydrolase [Salinisphaera sp. Q1T1-3]